MKYSIILTTYNNSQKVFDIFNFIKDLKDYELIIFDRGSNHNELSIMRDFINKKNMPNVMYYEAGNPVSIEYAVANARKLIRGEWILFIDENIYNIPKKFIHWLNNNKFENSVSFYNYKVTEKIKHKNKNVSFHKSNISSYLFNSRWFVENIKLEEYITNKNFDEIFRLSLFKYANFIKHEKNISLEIIENTVDIAKNDCKEEFEIINFIKENKKNNWLNIVCLFLVDIYKGYKKGQYFNRWITLKYMKTILNTIIKPNWKNINNHKFLISFLRFKLLFIKGIRV